MKTFYSVKYRSWGADEADEKWFDNESEAKEFASHNFRDKPVAHRCTSARTIEKYNSLI